MLWYRHHLFCHPRSTIRSQENCPRQTFLHQLSYLASFLPCSPMHKTNYSSQWQHRHSQCVTKYYRSQAQSPTYKDTLCWHQSRLTLLLDASYAGSETSTCLKGCG